jgi:hypothetical protein
MILQYQIERNSLTDALTEIQEFENRMVVFMEKYPHYTYDIQINETEEATNKWKVDLKIEKHEPENNQST